MTDDDPQPDRYDVSFAEAVADIITIRALLMDNRPLEALQIANEAKEQYESILPDQYQEEKDE